MNWTVDLNGDFGDLGIRLNEGGDWYEMEQKWEGSEE